MKENIVFQLGSEVLQVIALHDFPWPDDDPTAIDQVTATWSEEHSRLLDQAVENIRFSLHRFLEDTKALPLPEKLWKLIASSSFNFNSVTGVQSERYWLNRIESAVQGGEPIEVAYPLIAKVNNPAKRLTLVGCTAGERATIRFFRNMGHVVHEIYPPGIHINVLSDATLYNGALQVPQPSAYAYIREFQEQVVEEKAEKYVFLYDYSALLAPVYQEFEKSYNQHYRDLVQEPPGSTALSSLGSLPTSIRTNLNTRRLLLEYSQLRHLFGPGQTAFLPLRAEIDAQAVHALREQLAIKMACDDLDLPSELWPRSVRASCHRGLKRNRHVLGLRLYPEYYSRSRLLPYHGMPLIEADRRGRPQLIIAPEVSLRADQDLCRVLNQHGDPVLYTRGLG